MCDVKNMFTYWLNKGLPQKTWVEKAIDRLKHTDSPLKKKVRGQMSAKKVMLAVYWDIKGPITRDFLEKYITMNNASYCQLCRQNLP